MSRTTGRVTEGTDPARELEGRVLPGAGLTVAERLAVEAAVPSLKPRVREIVDVARAILDEEGVDALSMRAIAGRLGVRAPSLYKHLPDKQAILDVLIADILREHGDVMRDAIRGAEDPVGALFDAFRAWALEHPQRYEVCTSGPLDDSPLVRSASLYSGDPLRWVMRDDLEGAVTFWAFAHGLVDLEIKGRLPPAYDPDLIWEWGVARLRHPDDAVPSPDPLGAAAGTRGMREDLAEAEPLSERAERIVAVARELLEEEGSEAMSMRNIAARLGVRAPSLYKHVPDKKALEDAIVVSVLREQGVLGRRVTAEARAAGDDPLLAIVEAYRAWAIEHPDLYRLNMRGPLDGGPLTRRAEVESAEPLLEAVEGAGVAALAAWAFAHGCVDLELNDRFPPGYGLGAIRRRGVAALRPAGPRPEERS